MKHSIFLALTVILLSLSPALAMEKQVAAASQDEVLWDWWYVYGGGTSPSREVIYIDSLSIEKVVDHAAIMTTPIDKKVKSREKKQNGFPIDYVQADGIMISEDTEKAARVSGRINVKCNEQKLMFDSSYQTYWDTDRGVVTQAASPWLDVKNDLRYMQIAKFMCEPKARNDKNMMMRVDQSSDPLNRTWDIFWKDAKKPEFTTKKSRNQIDSEYKATLTKAQGTIKEGTAYAQKRLEGFKEEEAFMAAVRKTFQAKDKKFHTLFYSMPGWSEELINTAWGPPVRTDWDGPTRILTYPYQDTVYDQVQTQVDIMGCPPSGVGGPCGKVGETTNTNSVARAVSCERYLYLRPGGGQDGPRLVDYVWKCF